MGGFSALVLAICAKRAVVTNPFIPKAELDSSLAFIRQQSFYAADKCQAAPHPPLALPLPDLGQLADLGSQSQFETLLTDRWAERHGTIPASATDPNLTTSHRLLHQAKTRHLHNALPGAVTPFI